MFIARDARATTDRATMGDGRFRLDLPDGGVRGGAPLVVVCGWYGALDKHVVKYTDVMKSWGCATLRTIMPGSVFSPLSAGRSAYARDLLAATRAARAEHNLTDAPLYFMFMSNGGCWLWAAINDDGLMRPDGPFADLGAAAAGVVFDSCPAFMTLTSGAAVLSLGRPLLLRLLIPLLFFPRGCRDGSDVASLRRKLRGDAAPSLLGARFARAQAPGALPVQRQRSPLRRG